MMLARRFTLNPLTTQFRKHLPRQGGTLWSSKNLFSSAVRGLADGRSSRFAGNGRISHYSAAARIGGLAGGGPINSAKSFSSSVPGF